MPGVWRFVAAAFVLSVAACGSKESGSGPTGPTDSLNLPSGPFAFKASPIAQTAIKWITPLGNLNPPDHTLPTDHIYFYFAAPDLGESPAAFRTAFFAPANGTLTDIFTTGGGDMKLFIRATGTISYYVDHLIPDVPISRGMTINAGQRLGTTGSAYGIDLGVLNDSLTLSGFVNRSRYIGDTLHADAPLKYFDEPLRSQLYARVQRMGPDLDGKIDNDVAGRLAGNWFTEFGAQPLVFAYDTYDPSQVRIAVSGVLSQSGVFAIAASDIQPRDVSVASGKVVYTMTRSRTGPPVPTTTPSGQMLVQLLGEQRLQAEIFPLSASPTDFTGASRVFVR
jgi:hypothetical protein